MKIQNAILRYADHTFSLRQALGWFGIALLLALLGAHFFRAFEYGLVLCCLGVFVLHCGHAPWKRYAVALFLLWGAFEWGSTAFVLAQARMQAGLPWFRASLILWTVACITGLGAMVRYRQEGQSADQDSHARLKGIVFLSSFCAIYCLAQAAPVPLLIFERFFPRWGNAQIFFLAVYSVFILTVLLDPRRSRKGRMLVWLIFALLFFGQLALGLLGMEAMLMTGNLHVPVPGFIVFGPVFRGAYSMMVVLVLAATLLTGSAWCSMLCYFGAFDGLAAGSKPVKPITPTLQWLVRYGRLCVLAVGVLVAAGLGTLGLAVETAVLAAFIFVCASLLVMLLISRRYNSMLHCTAFCPLGIVINVLGKIAPWRVRVDPQKCDHCGLCEQVCKYRAISLASRTRGTAEFHCSLCLDCIPVCKQQAVSLRAHMLPFLDTTVTRVFLVLLVTVHATFVAFARM